MYKLESALETLKNFRTDFGYLMFYLTIKQVGIKANHQIIQTNL